MQFVGVADFGTRVFGDLSDGGWIENARATDEISSQGTTQLHGTGAAFFERRIIEKCVWIGVEDFMRKRRWCGVFDCHSADFAVFDRFEMRLQAIEIHGFVQAVVEVSRTSG